MAPDRPPRIVRESGGGAVRPPKRKLDRQPALSMSKLEKRVGDRFGVLPNFFRLSAETPEINEKLWGFAQAAYLDNPLPSLFKERLFVHLSRFCAVRYCIARHVGFLVGLGRPSGDARARPQSVVEVVKLLRSPFPRRGELQLCLSLCASCPAPLVEIPSPGSEMEVVVFALTSHVFLQTPDASVCLDALERLFGAGRLQYLLLFLAFVRAAHYWTKVHPEIALEDDIKQLMATHEELADCILNDPEASSDSFTQSVLDELPALRQRADRAIGLLAAIVDSSDDAIVGKDLNGIVTAWNPAAEKMFGYTAPEMIGRSIMTLIPPELQHEEVDIMRRLRNGERIDHFETHRLKKDGQRVDVSLTISPIRDATGKLVGASKIARDISDRLKVVDASLRLAAIVESSEDAIIAKDLSGIITNWNTAATKIFGYEPAEIIGHSVLRLIPRELHSEEPMILSRLRAGERLEHFESRRLRKDGRLIDVSLTISPIRDTSGKVIGASKIVRDITERKRIERALVESEKLAVAGRMAATLAHEVNNPLEAIMNLAFLLEKDTSLSASGRAYAETLLEQVKRASEITRQTLSFYRGTSVAVEVYLPALFEGILSSKKAKIEAKKVAVRVECNGSSRAWGIAGELSQLFLNLVENAIDAVGLGGHIRIRAHDLNARAVCISISDSGGGMSPETVRRAFEPFFTTKREKGTGLGLWVSQGIVRNHGGKIRVRTRQSTQWHGTTISVLLPTEEARGALNRLEPIAAD